MSCLHSRRRPYSSDRRKWRVCAVLELYICSRQSRISGIWTAPHYLSLLRLFSQFSCTDRTTMSSRGPSSTRWERFWALYIQAVDLDSIDGLASHLRETCISVLVANPPNYEMPRKQIIRELKGRMKPAVESLNVVALAGVVGELDLLRDICSHFRCLLTPLPVLIRIPRRYVEEKSFHNIAWFASTFFGYSGSAVSGLLMAFEANIASR